GVAYHHPLRGGPARRQRVHRCLHGVAHATAGVDNRARATPGGPGAAGAEHLHRERAVAAPTRWRRRRWRWWGRRWGRGCLRLAGAGHAVQREPGRCRVGGIPRGVEADLGRRARCDHGVPAGVADTDPVTALGVLTVPAVHDLLSSGEGPGKFPAVDRIAEVGDDDVTGEAAWPFAGDLVVDLAGGDRGLGGSGRRYRQGAQHYRGGAEGDRMSPGEPGMHRRLRGRKAWRGEGASWGRRPGTTRTGAGAWRVAPGPVSITGVDDDPAKSASPAAVGARGYGPCVTQPQDRRVC